MKKTLIVKDIDDNDIPFEINDDKITVSYIKKTSYDKLEPQYHHIKRKLNERRNNKIRQKYHNDEEFRNRVKENAKNHYIRTKTIVKNCLDNHISDNSSENSDYEPLSQIETLSISISNSECSN